MRVKNDLLIKHSTLQTRLNELTPTGEWAYLNGLKEEPQNKIADSLKNKLRPLNMWAPELNAFKRNVSEAAQTKGIAIVVSLSDPKNPYCSLFLQHLNLYVRDFTRLEIPVFVLGYTNEETHLKPGENDLFSNIQDESYEIRRSLGASFVYAIQDGQENVVWPFCLMINDKLEMAQNWIPRSLKERTEPSWILAEAIKTKFNVRDGAVKPYNELAAFERYVIEGKGTERPYSGEYWNLKSAGLYLCRKCNNPLYTANDKFDSHCGWPSFDDEISHSVTRIIDADGYRTEIICSNCKGHLGHVFEGEGFTDKNIRHCVNSVSVKFIPAK